MPEEKYYLPTPMAKMPKERGLVGEMVCNEELRTEAKGDGCSLKI